MIKDSYTIAYSEYGEITGGQQDGDNRTSCTGDYCINRGTTMGGATHKTSSRFAPSSENEPSARSPDLYRRRNSHDKRPVYHTHT